jgi:hypothetical protein
VAWKTIRGRKVYVKNSGRKRARRSEPSRSGSIRFLFGRSRTPEEHIRLEEEKARKRETKARLKAIKYESKARAEALKRVGRERAKAEEIRVLREAEANRSE